MKKIISSIILLTFSFVLFGCFTETTTIEFVQTPKSVYTAADLDKLGSDPATRIDNFKSSVIVRITGLGQFFLTDERLLVEGLEGISSRTPGNYTLSVTYNTATIYFQYRIGDEVVGQIPDTTWYNDEDKEFVIYTPEQLLGFATIVNDLQGEYQNEFFEGKTVKLGSDIDLTNYVWTPIGQGPRKSAKLLEANLSLSFNNQIIYKGSSLTVLLNAQGQPVNSDGSTVVATGRDYARISGTDKRFVHLKQDNKVDLYEIDGSLTGAIFKGTFDGQNYTIKGLSDAGYNPTDASFIYPNSYTIVRGYTFGLFGRAAGNVTFKDIKLSEVSISGSYLVNNDIPTFLNNHLDSAGALLGLYQDPSEGTSISIENCEVVSGSIHGYDAIGGLVGRIYYPDSISIKNVKNYASISLTGKKAGGIVGYISALGIALGIENQETKGTTIILDNCKNYGDIYTNNDNEDYYLGGMVSYINSHVDSGKGPFYKSVTVTNCINYGNITLDNSKGKNNMLGGIFQHSRCELRNDVAPNQIYSGNANYGILKYKNTNDTLVTIDDATWGLPK